jgi:hypothetical protein
MMNSSVNMDFRSLAKANLFYSMHFILQINLEAIHINMSQVALNC